VAAQAEPEVLLHVLADLLSSIEAIDRDVLQFVTCRLYHPLTDPILIWAQEVVVAVPFVVVGLLLLAFWRPRRAHRAVFAIAVGYGIAMGIATVMWATIERHRPPAVFEQHLTTPEQLADCANRPDALALRKDPSGSPSFPSRHALSTGVIVAVFCLAWWRFGIVAVLYGILVIVGRVYGAKHWPSDVIVGAAMGALIGWGMWRLAPRIFDLVGRGHWMRDPPEDAEPASA
jgi:membrane-associated phospholipid phosphatase